MKLFFHGASVTQQSKSSSYFNVLKSLGEREFNANFDHRGYGGCHFNDAGFLTLDRDVSSDVDICFLEWNTTGLDNFDEHKLLYVYELLKSKLILPVFLILARRDNSEKNRTAETQVLNFATKHSMLVLDYRHMINLNEHLRDEVHTNELGAKIYAEALMNDLPTVFKKFTDSLLILKREAILQPQYIIREAQCKPFRLLEGQTKVFDIKNLQLNAEVILEVTIGPSSGFIEINNGLSRINFWDKWCHFERPSFKRIYKANEFNSNDVLLIKMLSDNVDYSVCRREFNYEGVKELQVKSVWGINCTPHPQENN